MSKTWIRHVTIYEKEIDKIYMKLTATFKKS